MASRANSSIMIFKSGIKAGRKAGMVKRPMVLLTLFYLFGILAGNGGGRFFLLFPALVILLFLFPYLIKKYQGERLFFLAPLFFAAGFFLTRQALLATPLEQYAASGGSGSVSGTVLSSVEGQNSGRMVLLIRAMEGAGESVIGCRILVYTKKEELAAPGSEISVYGEWMTFSVGDNPGQFDEYRYYKAQGISAKLMAKEVWVTKEKKGGVGVVLWQLRSRMKAVYRKVLPETEAGILEAMLLAEKGGLSQEIKQMYRDAGFSHILAVSGLHLSLLGMGFYKLLKRLRAGSNAAVVLACVLVVLYSMFTGLGIPVVRAAIMLLLALFAAPAGKTYDAPTGLAASALVILARQPLQLFMAGFLLSFGAVAGILLFSNVFLQLGVRKFAASLGVQLALLPLLLWFYYEVPVYSLLLNLLVVPFLSLLLVLAVLIGGLGSIWLFAGKFFAGGAYVLLRGYGAVCRINEKLPGYRFCYGRPAVWQMFLYYALLIGFYFLCQYYVKKQRGGRKCFLFLGVFLIFLLPGEKELTVTQLAVGQGDCAVLQKGGMTVLVDAGSSVKNGAERILIPYLQYHGDTVVEYVFLSHTDEDHCSMLLELLDRMAQGRREVVVKTLVMTKAAEKEEKYALLCEKAEAAEVAMTSFAAGDMLPLGGEWLVCLSPEEGEDAGGTNENSMVLALSGEEVFWLFTGDIAQAQEKKVVEKLGQYAAFAEGKQKYLKAAHHGSKYSNSAQILQHFTGGTAVISCGRGNRYGHPHAEALFRMEEADIHPVLTWESGAVRWRGGRLYLWNAYSKGEGEWR